MGIILAAILGLYLLVSLGVVIGAMVYARREGRSAKRWGWSAALVMYLIPFWDWIPTVAMHRYYCATEAGFWVYKTPEQWKKENPGVMQTLVANKGYPSSHEGDMADYTTTNFLNSRFNLVVKHRGPLLLHRWLREDTLIDTKTNEILARYVDFSTSQERRQAGWTGWKFWLDSRNCVRGLDKAIESGKFIDQFRGAEK
ncbi:MAG: hypothetical protein WC023_15455 [Rhodocyclaceae bacterium]